MSDNNLELEYPITEVKAIVHKWLYLEDDNMIDVMLATFIANQLRGDPLWMIFIAPPSHTKTELLRAFDGHEKIVLLSNLTPSTLVSGIQPKRNQEDPSLLPKLNGKTLILKDFTTVLSMRSENQQEILSQLREIYDGQYSKAFGNGKVVNWKGRVGLMAACTTIYDKHYGIIGALGDRFLLYRSENVNGKNMGIQALKIAGKEEEMRKEIGDSFHRFINQFKKLDHSQVFFNEDFEKMIVNLACFCAIARCPVERDYKDRHIKYIPSPEGPARLVKQFMQIGNGLALAQGKLEIDSMIYSLINKIGCDLIPAQRLRIIIHLFKERAFESSERWLKTRNIADAVMIPSPTTSLILEDLMIVRILAQRTEADGLTSANMWCLKNDVYKMIIEGNIFK
jgi:hypothetical protein